MFSLQMTSFDSITIREFFILIRDERIEFFILDDFYSSLKLCRLDFCINIFWLQMISEMVFGFSV